MKRLRHRLFNFAAAVSLLLCIMTVAVWVRSYWVADQLTYSAFRLPGLLPGQETEWIYQRYWGIYQGDGAIHVWIVREAAIAEVPADIHISRRPFADWKFRSEKRGGGPSLSRRYDTFIHRVGFAYSYSNTRGMDTPFQNGRIDFSFPHWAIALATFILPALGLIRFRQRRLRLKRLSQNCCAICGYDLRATPEHCPECGAIPLAAKGAVA